MGSGGEGGGRCWSQSTPQSPQHPAAGGQLPLSAALASDLASTSDRPGIEAIETGVVTNLKRVQKDLQEDLEDLKRLKNELEDAVAIDQLILERKGLREALRQSQGKYDMCLRMVVDLREKAYVEGEERKARQNEREEVLRRMIRNKDEEIVKLKRLMESARERFVQETKYLDEVATNLRSLASVLPKKSYLT